MKGGGGGVALTMGTWGSCGDGPWERCVVGLLMDSGLAGQAAGASGPHSLCGLPRVLLNNSASPPLQGPGLNMVRLQCPH